jgi:putative glutamine amidotransferase
VEGVRVMGAPGFAYGVQWHPEWRHEQTPFYENTLQAFAQACRAYRKQREEGE